MEITVLILAVIAFIGWVPNTLEMIVGFLYMPLLPKVPPLPHEQCPLLSIVVPACNEAETLEPAMRSLLALDYPRLEIIAVNDRSTDDTGKILNRIAAGNSKLRVEHIDELPEGWLGKNHALQRGAGLASGEWILFTDADIVYESDALRRAMAVALEKKCDHLVALPRMMLDGFWEKALVSLFSILFNFMYRPWQTTWRKSAYVGVGAFGMVRTDVYRKLEGHKVLRMEVLDDVKLGKLIKRSGHRQAVIVGSDCIRVRWLVGLNGLVKGLEKNTFAGVGYSWLAAFGSCGLVILMAVWPFAGVWIGGLLPRILCGSALLAMCLSIQVQWPTLRVSILYLLAWPLAAVLFFYIMMRSGFLAQRQGGVYWRGTLYPLDELKKNVV